MIINKIVLIVTLVFFMSCKKNYTCYCYSDRRGYIIEQFTNSYKEKEKSTALSKCNSDYEGSSNYVNGGYCEIK